MDRTRLGLSEHRRRFLIMLGAVVGAAVVGWIAGSQISSPADLAANTSAPEASPILVPAEERVLSSDIVTRGTARFGSPQQLFVASSALKSDAGIAAQLPIPGSELGEGSLLMTKSGRPVFLMAGGLPASRDMGPGVTGDDVRQLEEALFRMGIDPGPIDGIYDDLTATAVESWYAANGFAAFTASQAELDALRALSSDSNAAQSDLIAAQDAVTSAQIALDTAIATYNRALQTASDTQAAIGVVQSAADARVRAAEADIQSRTSALNLLEGTDFVPPEAIATARADLAAARAALEVARATGAAEVESAEAAARSAASEVDFAQAAISGAEAALANAQSGLAIRSNQASLTASELNRATARAGVQVPADEVVFVPSLPIRVSDVAVIAGEPISGQVMTVTDSSVAVDGALRLQDAPLVSAGMMVEIDEPDLNISETGVVGFVADGPGTRGADGFHVYFEVFVDGSPSTVVGSSVRLTIPVESSGGAVLAVPVSAVTLSVDGSSRVQKQVGQALEFVAVEPGFSAEGYVQVTPLDGTLQAGDLVVVGFDPGTDIRAAVP